MAQSTLSKKQKRRNRKRNQSLSTDTDETDSGSAASLNPAILIEKLEHSDVYIVRGTDNVIKLVTRCVSSVDDEFGDESFYAKFRGKFCKFRIWSPYHSKLAAAFLSGVDNVRLVQGAKVIFLGGSLGSAISHVADIVDSTGRVYAVETNRWAAHGLASLANRRHNVVAITDDPMMPYKYRQRVVDSVDFIFCDMLHQEHLRILILHARHFLKAGGQFAIMLPDAVQEHFCADAITMLKKEHLETREQISLRPYVHGQMMLVGVYNRPIVVQPRRESERQK